MLHFERNTCTFELFCYFQELSALTQIYLGALITMYRYAYFIFPFLGRGKRSREAEPGLRSQPVQHAPRPGAARGGGGHRADPGDQGGEGDIPWLQTPAPQMYRNWMNSLGVQPRVNYLYSDLYNGLVIFQVGQTKVH